jgi:alpha-beta hydrolase superfamily lysophospholipase
MTALPLIRSFTDKHGIDIVFYEWPVANARAVVQLVHGLGEHARRYDHVAAALNRAGYAVYATDHRGHGQTGVNMRAAGQIKRQGNVGVGGMRAVYANELQLTDLINSEHPGLAVALIAHSWGSMIGQRILNANSNRFAAVVLSGSTLLVPGILPPGNFNKRWNDTPNKSGFEWLSRNAEVGQKFAADPLNFPESAMEVFGLANTLQLLGLPTKAIRSDLPMLLIAGSEDALGAERGNQFLLKALLRAGLKDVELIIYHGGRHESFNEINQGEVITDVIDWLNGELSV